MSKITKVTPNNKGISFIIHINNKCNFKCEYCVAGRDFSKDSLSLSDIYSLVKIFKLLNHKKDSINIDITGGEPTLHMYFSEILTIFLESGTNLNIQISTNGLLLKNFNNYFKSLSLPHKDNLYFNISFHFFEYKDKVDSFIDSIKNLKSHDLDFKVKFLLPDNNTSLEEFIDVRDYIIKKTNILKEQYYYDLILDTTGSTSKSYDKGILDLFNNFNSSNNFELLDDEKIYFDEVDDVCDKDLNVLFEDGDIKYYTNQELRNSGLNKFRGYNCKYVSKDNLKIQVSHRGDISFGPCYTLDKLRYKIEDIYNIVSKGEKNIICSDTFCPSGLFLEKNISNNYYNFIKVENLIKSKFKSLSSYFIFKDLSLGFKSELKIIFKDKSDNNIFFIIEPIIDINKYIYTYNGLGIYFYVKDNKNIPINKNEFYITNKNTILLVLKNILMFKDSLVKVIK